MANLFPPYHVLPCVRVNDRDHAFPPSCDRERGDDRHDPCSAREIRDPFHVHDWRDHDRLK